MKTNLLRIGLRLSLVVIALLCGVHLAWGQEGTTRHMLTYKVKNLQLSVNNPTEVTTGESLDLTVIHDYTAFVDCNINKYSPHSNVGPSSFWIDTSGNTTTIHLENIRGEGDIVIEITGYRRVTAANNYVYGLNEEDGLAKVISIPAGTTSAVIPATYTDGGKTYTVSSMNYTTLPISLTSMTFEGYMPPLSGLSIQRLGPDWTPELQQRLKVTVPEGTMDTYGVILKERYGIEDISESGGGTPPSTRFKVSSYMENMTYEGPAEIGYGERLVYALKYDAHYRPSSGMLWMNDVDWFKYVSSDSTRFKDGAYYEYHSIPFVFGNVDIKEYAEKKGNVAVFSYDLVDAFIDEDIPVCPIGEMFSFQVLAGNPYDGPISDFKIEIEGYEPNEYTVDIENGAVTIANVKGDGTIRITGYLNRTEGDLTYRFERRSGKNVTGIKAYSGTATECVIPSSYTYEGVTYTVNSLSANAFENKTGLNKITLPEGLTEIGDSAFKNCSGLAEIRCLATTPATVYANSFKGVDTESCVIYVPAGSVSTYQAADGWKDFKNIVEAGKEITYAVTYDLTNLSAIPQPITVKRDSTLAFSLTPGEGYKLPDSVLVNGKNTPAFYDKASGMVSIPNVRTELQIKAVALEPDTTHIAVKDTTLSDVTVDHINIAGITSEDTAKVNLSSVTTPTLNVASGAKAELILSGENNLGEITNEGTLIISTSGDESQLITTSVSNEGVLVDETGLITEVTGIGALAITPIGDKAIEEGSSINLTASAIPEETYSSVTFLWQKLENDTWTDKRTTENVNAPAPRSYTFLRAAVAQPLTDSYNVTASEAGTYRCKIISKVNANVSTTLTTVTEVTVASIPAPSITYSVTLPFVEGASTNPVAGSYSVEEGESFSFSLTLNADYDQSIPIVKIGDKVIEPIFDGKYELKGITSDITISITGIVKNATVGNAEVESNALKVWGSNGVLHIRSAHAGTAYLVTFGGQLYKAITLPVGETMITIPQGSYIIRIENQSYKIRF